MTLDDFDFDRWPLGYEDGYDVGVEEGYAVGCEDGRLGRPERVAPVEEEGRDRESEYDEYLHGNYALGHAAGLTDGYRDGYGSGYEDGHYAREDGHYFSI